LGERQGSLEGVVANSLASGRVSSDFWIGKRVFLTGHTGFTGSWLVAWLSEMGASVRGYALKPPTRPSMFEALDLEQKCDYVQGDVRDLQKLTKAIRGYHPDIVLHLAAQPLVRASYQEPVGTYETNVMGTVSLLQACRSVDNLRVIINVTTDKCYENREWVWGYRESDRLGGYDPYSSSKACSELVTSAFRQSFFNPERFEEHRVAVATARSGNVVGGGDWSQDRLIPDAVRAYSQGRVLGVRNPEAVRPWQHVLEAVRGYLELAQGCFDDGAGYSGAWNFGPGEAGELTVREVIEEFSLQWGDGSVWSDESIPNQPHEAGHLHIDSTKARRRLRWQPKIDFESAMALTAQWYKTYYNRCSSDEMYGLTVDQIAASEAIE